jgi:translation machinery-associated protein 16
MAPSATKAKAKATKSNGKKEKIFHPQSRKAAQISRASLRKDKMSEAVAKRTKKQATQGMFTIQSEVSSVNS